MKAYSKPQCCWFVEGNNSEIAESEWHAPWGPGWRGRGGRGRRPFRGRGGGIPREPYAPEQDEGRPAGEYPDRFVPGPPKHREVRKGKSTTEQ